MVCASPVNRARRRRYGPSAELPTNMITAQMCTNLSREMRSALASIQSPFKGSDYCVRNFVVKRTAANGEMLQPLPVRIPNLVGSSRVQRGWAALARTWYGSNPDGTAIKLPSISASKPMRHSRRSPIPRTMIGAGWPMTSAFPAASEDRQCDKTPLAQGLSGLSEDVVGHAGDFEETVLVGDIKRVRNGVVQSVVNVRSPIRLKHCDVPFRHLPRFEIEGL